VFAETVLVILPSVFDEPLVLSANQFHDAYVAPLTPVPLASPTVKPSVPKAVKPFDCVASAEISLD
jgi:hypothetical protein